MTTENKEKSSLMFVGEPVKINICEEVSSYRKLSLSDMLAGFSFEKFAYAGSFNIIFKFKRVDGANGIKAEVGYDSGNEMIIKLFGNYDGIEDFVDAAHSISRALIEYLDSNNLLSVNQVRFNFLINHSEFNTVNDYEYLACAKPNFACDNEISFANELQLNACGKIPEEPIKFRYFTLGE